MLTFGACSDAVLCGHLIEKRVQERNAELKNPHLQFDLHIGMDFGEATMLPDGNLRADAANRAARVCSECPAGEVYFTANVEQHLHGREVEIAHVRDFDLKGVSKPITVHSLVNWHGTLPHSANPFVWRGGITEAGAFFNREPEQRRLKNFLQQRQNSQIVGERRIGKTSLLLQVARQAAEWMPNTRVAFMDMQHPMCFTLNGFLRRVGEEFGLAQTPNDLTEFAEGIEALCRQGQRPVLCLDEFEECIRRREQFSRDFLLTLRSCSLLGMSLITASHQPLSSLTDPNDHITSPFFNVFPLLALSTFTEHDAADFLAVFRSGIPAVSPDEKTRILDFARCHPLALQVACYYVVEAKERGEQLSLAIQRANEEMRVLLPSW